MNSQTFERLGVLICILVVFAFAAVAYAADPLGVKSVLDQSGDVSSSSDVAGVRCDIENEGFLYDLQGVAVTHDEGNMYFDWIFENKESVGECHDVSFWAGIDVDQDEVVDYRAVFTQNDCEIIVNESILYLASDESWPPEALYGFESDDYAVEGNVFVLSVPREQIADIDSGEVEDNVMNVQMGVGDEETSCNDVVEMFTYSFHSGVTSAGFVFENNMKMILIIILVLLVIAAGIFVLRAKKLKMK